MFILCCHFFGRLISPDSCFLFFFGRYDRVPDAILWTNKRGCMTWPVPEPEIDNRQTSGLTEQSGNPSRKIVGLQVPDVLQQSFLMALHRHSWTLIDRATSKSQQRRNLSISLLELAPRNFFVHDHNYFLFTVGLSSYFIRRNRSSSLSLSTSVCQATFAQALNMEEITGWGRG